jgi:hypothetical protein
MEKLSRSRPFLLILALLVFGIPASPLPNDSINPIFAATVQATEEAIINAMMAAETMTGIDGKHRLRHPSRSIEASNEEIQPLNEEPVRLRRRMGGEAA